MSTGSADTALQPDVLANSEQMIAVGSKSFAAAARLFSRQTRADAVMLYAWCRHADDVVDGQELGHKTSLVQDEDAAERLERLTSETKAALEGRRSDDPVFEALRQVVQRNQIPHRHPLELLKGFEMDVGGRVYASEEDTLDYCYHVAGVVGVMMAMIMGVRDEAVLDRASDLGLGFQLTNIARDVIDDARAGRVYLPAEWLQATGIEKIDPDSPEQRKALHTLALRLLDQAEPYYRSAYAGLPALPFRSAWAVAAARRVYRDIGNQLRKKGPQAWDGRVSTSKSRKLVLLGFALKDVIVTRFASTADGVERTDLFQRPRG
ncbi:MAG: phytoene/squalene synthase family protein [Pseudomonadota bacterium]